MKWILIIWISWGYGMAMDHIEFSNKNGCIMAGKAVTNKHRSSSEIKFVCVKKEEINGNQKSAF